MPASNPPPRPSAEPPAPRAAGTVDDALDEALLDTLPAVELDALRWSVRASDGLTAQAQAEFDAWLGASPAHREAWEDMAGVWAAIDEIPPAGQARLRTAVAIEAAAASSAQDMALTGGTGTASQPTEPAAHPASPAPHAPAVAAKATAPHRSGPSRRLLPQAVVAVMALGMLGGGWAGWAHWRSLPVFEQHYASARGQSVNVALPDGSRLLLDTATQADVTLYRDRREVRLPEGQVLFHVQGDAARPFDVLAGAARITVVGTKFSVRHTPSLGSQAVQVQVVEGLVRVAGRHAVEITAGQAVTADGHGELGAVVKVPADAVAAWRGRRLNFDGAPLVEVLAEIGRYGDVPVRLADADTGRLALTASIDLHQLDAFVRTLPQVLPVSLVQRNGALEIEALRP